MLTHETIMSEMMRLTGQVDELLNELQSATLGVPGLHRTWRDVLTRETLSCEEKTVKMREMRGEREALDARLEYEMAAAREAFLKNAISARKQQLSTLQTIAGSMKAEMQMATYGPDFKP